MRKQTLALLAAIIPLTSCTCGAGGLCSFQVSDRSASVGQGYVDSLKATMLACNFQPDNREPQPGDAYRDAQTAAEDADCHEDLDNS